jgi:predicted PurR-regulated permease PerM
LSLLTPSLPVSKPRRGGPVNIIALGVVIALLYFGRVFFITLVIAIITAFLLDPAVRLFMKMRLPRGLASFIVCSIALLIVYLIGLGLYTEALAMVEDLPAYGQRVNQLVDQFAARIDQVERGAYETLVPKRYRETPPPGNTQTNAGVLPLKKRGRNVQPPPQPPPQPPAIQEVHIHRDPTPIYSYIYNYVRSFYNVALMASFIPFLVYFMLSWRDHLRRSFLYLFSAVDRPIAGKSWEGVAEIARAYVLGNFILGVLLGIVSAGFFIMMRLPYAFVVGPISGFLSLVPYVGVPLAVLPPIIAALAVYTQPAVYIAIALVVTLFHLLALNLLYPKMVGSRVHLNPLVVTIALMFWGTLWGGIGLLLAIPLTAGIKAVCDNISTLNAYGKLLGD